MIVVIDTTEFFKDPLMGGPDWVLMQEFVRHETVRVVVPGIVVQETLNHFTERLAKSLDDVKREFGKLRKLLPQMGGFDLPEIDREQAVQNFTEHFHARLKEFRAEQPDFREVSIERLVSRSLARRKPFDEHGRAGFRDALIWEAVLAVAQKCDDSVVVITGNSRDFGKHGELACDLQGDLQRFQIGVERVTISGGLSQFIEEYVKPRLEQLEEIRRSIDERRFPGFDPDHYFVECYDEVFEAVSEAVRSWDFGMLRLYSLFDSPKLVGLGDTPNVVEIGGVYRVGDDHVALSIIYTVFGTIQCQEEEDNGPEEPPTIRDFSGEVKFEVPVSIVMELCSGQVDEFEIEDIQIELGSAWPNA